MTLAEIAYQRACFVVRRVGAHGTLTPATELGDLFDDPKLGELLIALNGNAIGFRDFMKGPLAKSRVAGSTTIGDLGKSIAGNSAYATVGLYQGAMMTSMRLAVREGVAQLAHVDPETVSPDQKLSDYGVTVDQMRGWLIGSRYAKYLLQAPTSNDLSGRLGTVRERLVGRCLA